MSLRAPPAGCPEMVSCGRQGPPVLAIVLLPEWQRTQYRVENWVSGPSVRALIQQELSPSAGCDQEISETEHGKYRRVDKLPLTEMQTREGQLSRGQGSRITKQKRMPTMTAVDDN